MGVLKTRMPLPIWADGNRPAQGLPTLAPAERFPDRTEAEKRVIRSNYTFVEHSLDATGPAAHLVRQAIDFRAMYGEWGLTNVAVFEYTVNGVAHTLIAVSCKNAHSETRALQYLRSLRDGGADVQVTRVYTEREPCEGTANHHCGGALANDPMTTNAEIFATWPYPNDPDVNAEVNKNMKTHMKELEETARQEEAAQRSLDSDALHILPIHGSFPQVEDAVQAVFPGVLPVRTSGSAAFRASDVARSLAGGGS